MTRGGGWLRAGRVGAVGPQLSCENVGAATLVSPRPCAETAEVATRQSTTTSRSSRAPARRERAALIFLVSIFRVWSRLIPGGLARCKPKVSCSRCSLGILAFLRGCVLSSRAAVLSYCVAVIPRRGSCGSSCSHSSLASAVSSSALHMSCLLLLTSVDVLPPWQLRAQLQSFFISFSCR